MGSADHWAGRQALRLGWFCHSRGHGAPVPPKGAAPGTKGLEEKRWSHIQKGERYVCGSVSPAWPVLWTLPEHPHPGPAQSLALPGDSGATAFSGQTLQDPPHCWGNRGNQGNMAHSGLRRHKVCLWLLTPRVRQSCLSGAFPSSCQPAPQAWAQLGPSLGPGSPARPLARGAPGPRRTAPARLLVGWALLRVPEPRVPQACLQNLPLPALRCEACAQLTDACPDQHLWEPCCLCLPSWPSALVAVRVSNYPRGLDQAFLSKDPGAKLQDTAPWSLLCPHCQHSWVRRPDALILTD